MEWSPLWLYHKIHLKIIGLCTGSNKHYDCKVESVLSCFFVGQSKSTTSMSSRRELATFVVRPSWERACQGVFSFFHLCLVDKQPNPWFSLDFFPPFQIVQNPNRIYPCWAPSANWMILVSQAYQPMELMGFVQTSWSYWMILVPQSLSLKENS